MVSYSHFRKLIIVSLALLHFGMTQAQCPTITSTNNSPICSEATLSLTLTADIPGSTFTWIAADNPNVTGESLLLQNGSTINNTLTNNTLVAQTVTYTVTPTANGCTGASQTISVVVNPIPNAHGQNNVTVCNGDNVTEFYLSGDIPNTSFSWTSSNVTIGSQPTGSGLIIPTFVAQNTTSSNQTSTISVTPLLNGCAGIPVSHTITVLADPTVNTLADAQYCNSVNTSLISFSGSGTTYNWYNTNSSIGLGQSGTGNIPSFIANNSGSFPIVSTIVVTPIASSNGTTCSGDTTSFNITVNPNGVNNSVVIACSSYVWFGQSYTQTGNYIDTLINPGGCLQIEYLDLTISDTLYTNLSDSVCDFVAWNGNVYSQSGIYTYSTVTAQGCDSLVTIDLFVGKSSASSFDTTKFCSFFWPDANQTFTQSGFYQTILTNSEGCDSTISLNLDILEIEDSVTSSGATITAIASNVSYQWLDCTNGFSVISNQTQQSFTATANGSYAVEITDNANSCIDTSLCVLITEVGLLDIPSNAVKLSPNPAQQDLTIELPASLIGKNLFIVDPLGRFIDNVTIAAQKMVLEVGTLAKGSYLICIEGERPISFMID
jgi:hypothetical protein